MSKTKLLQATDGHSYHVATEATRQPVPDNTDDTESYQSRRHPLGVRPSGNALIATKNAVASMGALGRLPDELLMVLLEYLEQPADLTALGSTCRSLFAYCSHDQLWRDLATAGGHTFDWRGSWRSSLMGLPRASLPNIDCSEVYSDALHRPLICSQLDVRQFAHDIPTSNSVPRLADLSTGDFNARWTGRPFILTEPVKRWKVYQTWTLHSLTDRYASVDFRAEAVDWPFKQYMEYLKSTSDESPLYLFDRGFVEKMHLKVSATGDYEPPPCFQEDLFTVLGDQRPDHRWLIIGPERSGSTFHKDPNATSAWNAVITGSKYWIMFPPSILPPGVFMSEDQSEVTSPLSIAEWLLTYHQEARATPGCIEGVCATGEVLHVPSGWWHLVVNLDPAIAITQNFVPRSHLRSVIHFLDHKKAQISGFGSEVEDPLRIFLDRLRERYPDLAADLEVNEKKRKWDDIVAADEVQSEGFIFAFGDGLESDVE